MTLYPVGMLAILYWLHMLATVAWIGGLAALGLLVLPAARKTLNGTQYSDFLTQITRRIQLIGWISLVVLVGTGLFQMSASPFYQGFLAITNPWAEAILLKHIVIAGMTGLSVYLTWWLAPQIERLALLQAHGKGDPLEIRALQRREEILIQVNLGISVVILLLTALARSAQ
jgi:uncharacterized membrane protein